MPALLALLLIFSALVAPAQPPTASHLIYLPLAGAACVPPAGYGTNTQAFDLVAPGQLFLVRRNPCGGNVRMRQHWSEAEHCPAGCWGQWISVSEFTAGSFSFVVRVVQSWPGTTRIYDRVEFVDWSGWSFGVRALMLTPDGSSR